jgi:hypothetical protein
MGGLLQNKYYNKTRIQRKGYHIGHFVDLMKFEFYASKCVVFKNFLNLRISSSFLNIFLLNFIFQKFIFKIRWI